jgi:hypothetical protein
MPIPDGILRIENPIQKAKTMEIFHRVSVTRNFFDKSANVVAMIAVPFFALYFWLIYYRKRYNYSEHLVANLMFISFANLAFTLLVFPVQILLKGTPWIGFMPLLGLLFQLIYFCIAYRGFVQLKGFWPMFKIIIGTLIGLMLWIFFTQIISALYIYQSWEFMDYFKHMGGR